MKSCSIVAVLFLAVLGGSISSRGIAQQSGASANNSAQADPIQPEAMYVLAEFTNSVNAGKLTPGSQVRAEVAQDVLAHGKIIIPASSKLIGHVTEIKTRGSETPSRLGIIFDKVLLKHHKEGALLGVVHALAPPTQRRARQDEPDQLQFPSPGVGQGPSAPMGGSRSSSRRTSMQTIFPDLSTTSTDPNSQASWNREAGASAGSQAPPMSIGVRQGVYGMKGLTLSTDSSAYTPGPVILSTANDVKLEYGTQVIIKVKDGRTLQQ